MALPKYTLGKLKSKYLIFEVLSYTNYLKYAAMNYLHGTCYMFRTLTTKENLETFLRTSAVKEWESEQNMEVTYDFESMGQVVRLSKAPFIPGYFRYILHTPKDLQ